MGSIKCSLVLVGLLALSCRTSAQSFGLSKCLGIEFVNCKFSGDFEDYFSFHFSKERLGVFFVYYYTHTSRMTRSGRDFVVRDKTTCSYFTRLLTVNRLHSNCR